MARGRVFARAMTCVASRDQAAAGNGRSRLTHYHAVPANHIAWREIDDGQLMLRRNGLRDWAGILTMGDYRSGGERCKRNEHVIAWIELQDSLRHVFP